MSLTVNGLKEASNTDAELIARILFSLIFRAINYWLLYTQIVHHMLPYFKKNPTPPKGVVIKSNSKIAK
jgi:hypothetical protein